MTAAGGPVTIRPAEPADHDAIWAILQPVYRAGQTYCIPRDIAPADALADWFGGGFTVFVAVSVGQVLGSSHVGPNRPGGGAHVFNASFATALQARGRGVARALVGHACAWARDCGARAMQFNFVVATNADAVHLWQKSGFSVVGRLPGAFEHPEHGFVDALVMYRDLTQGEKT